ncbi:MAG: lipopolysaccharide heptosyltransferase I [Pyrinomonadaceae bacterium]|nr:lipopolysaccharide heptosyltransferase I [Pyrinomonadaceae bacterium]
MKTNLLFLLLTAHYLLLTIMRILIVKLGSIGDIVHTLPVLAAIREALPRASLSWAVERRSAEILQNNSLLERLIEVDTKRLRNNSILSETIPALRTQLRDLRATEFDVALDFQGLLKSATIALVSGARERFGFAGAALREPASRFLLSRTMEVPLQAHVIEKNLALAAGALGIEVPHERQAWRFPIAVSPAHEAEAETVALRNKDNFAVLNPGGGWATKLWSAERFASLADELWERHQLRSIVVHGPGEETLAARVVEASRANRTEAASLSLKGLIALLRRARVYVGGDTGPTHLAVATGTPIVGLFGPTEWWRNGSSRHDDICVERHDINCRAGCHRRSCSAWVCMDIEVERVLNAVTERLERARRAERAGESVKAGITNAKAETTFAS